MNFKKSVFFIISIFILIFCNISNGLDNQSKHNNNDLNPPIIEDICPSKCQEYIIGRPCIKASYKDLNGIDLSSIKLFLNYEDITDKCKITKNSISYTPSKRLKRGTQIAKLEVCDLSLNKNKQVLEWYFTVGTPIYKHYRGLLHSHIDTLPNPIKYDDAYYIAKYKSNLDFFAITEHSNELDNSIYCNIDNASASSKWSALIKSRDKFTVNGSFIPLSGFEITYDNKQNSSFGHINIFNSNGLVCSNQPDMKLDDFYKLINEHDDLIGQFNNPCINFGTFSNFKYSSLGDKIMCLLEVGSGDNVELQKNYRYDDMYQIALDKGWHIAPTCNQNNQKTNFGIANEFRTVILSTDLNKDSLFDSLKNRRVYATEDKNIKIDYTINDLPLGSIITNPSKLSFSITAIDNDLNDKITEIQVISNNGQIIKSTKFNSNLAKLDFNIKPEKNKFYYIKVIENKNKISLTAPIWIK
ncbi:hypothetical protein CHF27_000245 [Romboutsia maritimum]|uniref:Uncharacterized protein n=1 Tax=Romboutsia maritimum TaxID=2020948 RepID=A0A371IW09_9FIRM|nr:hypothetical protein [Romboutsia maritimum]RDY24665.1 hypothetical protein CHF27_000245 [Romboutsia maritimum]